MSNRICAVEGCDRVHSAKGYCRRHYLQWYKKTYPEKMRRPEHPCTIPDCGKPIIARGWCSLHYTRWRTYGNPTTVRETRTIINGGNRPKCTVEGCQRPAKNFKGGLCLMHYGRNWRYGSTAGKMHFLLSVDPTTMTGYCEKCGPDTPIYANGPGLYRCKPSHRDKSLKKQYGLSIFDYERMLESQGAVCAICEGPPTSKKRLHVDHHHESGRVRALLCGHCNAALGYLREDRQIALRVIEYLDLHC